jgi:hypothetical protein
MKFWDSLDGEVKKKQLSAWFLKSHEPLFLVDEI